MRIGLFSSTMALLAGIGTATAQAPRMTETSPLTPYSQVARGQPDSPETPKNVPPASSEREPTLPAPRTTSSDTAPAATLTPSFDPGADVAGPVGPPPGPWNTDDRYYGGVEYILWRFKAMPLPTVQLIVPFSVSGLNDLNTTVTMPSQNVDYAGRSGGRFTLGYWILPDHLLGFEANYTKVESRYDDFITTQVSNLTMNVEVIQNITEITVLNGVAQITLTQEPVTVALPGQLVVNTQGNAGPTDFWGTEWTLRSTRAFFGGVAFDFIAGMRYINLTENFNLIETISLQAADPNTIFTNGAITNNAQLANLIPPAITNFRTIVQTTSSNNISTRNQYYGAQVGTSFEWWFTNRITLNGMGKIGVGGMTQVVTITSFTSSTSASGTGGNSPGGIFNPIVGNYQENRTRYAVVPEFGFNLGYQLTSYLKASVGYNLLYMTTVARPGNQVAFGSTSSTINIAGTGVTTNTLQPTFNYQDSSIYIQGLTAGLEFRY